MLPRRMLLPLLCGVLLLGAASCGDDGDGDDDSSASTTTTGGDDNGPTTTAVAGGDQTVTPDPSTPISLAPSDTVTLELEANPTTGYSWEITIADEGVATEASDTYEATSGGAVGSGGRQLVEIEGVAPGETTVEAVYVRPFEPDQPAQTETWTIEVGD